MGLFGDLNQRKSFQGSHEAEGIESGSEPNQKVASDAFVDLTSLEDLGLNSNEIQFLHKNTFASLKALKELYLGTNKIETLHPEIFSSLMQIKFIELRRNRILNLNEKAFDDLPNLQSVDLIGNLCNSERYDAAKFDSMRTDLKNRCNENSIQEEPEKNLEVQLLNKKDDAANEISQSSYQLASKTFIFMNIIVVHLIASDVLII